MRDRLIELITKSHCVDTWNHYTDDFKEPNPIYELADYLLADGWIRPPCKVGDTVWCIREDCKIVIEEVVGYFYLEEDNKFIFINDREDSDYEFGVNAFVSREEAETALRKEDEGK